MIVPSKWSTFSPKFHPGGQEPITANIPCGNWGIWVLNTRKTSPLSFYNAETALQEWLIDLNTDLEQSHNIMEAAADITGSNTGKNEGRHRLHHHTTVLRRL
ncbi:hypothetical protein PSHT_12581 [Puccinia striiformis]|uniref:Uncharacterized protein n=1 Tax=Puccinia striiformis TaxID=27350 RepID=A0A2S4UVQ7_9BASI|nr:hypothetical protein PSHT_12581 [Puccinia striiformis]